jgi:NAD(P)H-dependent flavin oxidoreductase YrpB (nitropropane dioxygenase family)
MRTRVCELFDITYPIFAFSHSRDVVAAVSKAGGLGVLGAVAYSPQELEDNLAWIDEHVDGKPYGVDIVVPAVEQAAGAEKIDLESMVPEAHRQWVQDLLRRYNVPDLPESEEATRGLLGWTLDQATRQAEIAFAHPIKLLASALGPPPREAVDEAHRRGALVAALAGTPEHAKRHVEAGCDMIVAVGTEAGGHTGAVSTMVLVPQVVDAVRPVPVAAAGGIGEGRQVAAALALGAEAVWTGSIWLTTEESDTHPVVIEKLLHAGSSDTVRSRAMTGKPARLLRTAWTDAWDGVESPGALPMPLQFLLNAEATSRMHRFADESEGARELVTSPVGQIVGSMNRVRSVDDVMSELVRGFGEAAGALHTAASG